MAGDVLPLHVIYGGKTKASQPSQGTRAEAEGVGFAVTHMASHWQTLESNRIAWYEALGGPDMTGIEWGWCSFLNNACQFHVFSATLLK